MNNDPYEELITLVNKELKSGIDKSEVIDKLVLIGIERDVAEAIIQELCKSKPYYSALIVLVLGVAISVGIFYVIYSLIGMDRIISLTWPTAGAFVGSFLLWSLFSNFSGKIFALLRVVFSFSAVLFAIFLTFSLFMHNDWGEAPDFHMGGRWGILLKFIVEIFYFIGSTGFASLMVAISFFILCISWVALHSFAEGNYDKV